MKAAKKIVPLEIVEAPKPQVSPSSLGTSLTPQFEVSFRRRHADDAPIETVRIAARTIASARHAARLAHPQTVILSVKKL